MTKDWRLILDGKCDGYYNMAVDEAVFRNYCISKVPVLRIYGWQRPFVSLGYNQRAREVLVSNNGIPFVRRLTGGAAILHNQEITYSLSCRLSDLDLPCKVKDSYAKLCAFLIEFYSLLGLKADFAKDYSREVSSPEGNFCFSSLQYFDVVINKRKLGGNAQRRSRDMIFQHGSIPQKIDCTAVRNTIKGVNSFEENITSLDTELSKETSFDYLADVLSLAFSKTFSVKFAQSPLSTQERESSVRLIKNKYSIKNWNGRI